MPTTNRSFPASEQTVTDERDPQQRILRALNRTRAELEIVLGEVTNARTVELRLELVDRALRLHFLGSRLSRRLSMLGEGGLLALSAIRETDVASIVRECAAEVAPECGRRQISLDLRLDPGLRSTWLDAEQLSEAVRCLIDNAMEALSEQGTLFLEARNDAHGLSILVRDDRGERDEAAPHGSELYVAARFAEALDGELMRHPAGLLADVVTETILRIPVTRASELSEATAPRSNAA
jgi:signal transduction histidine kinase